ncbi:MAG: putative DNA binding domain-containing protein [Candidatus Poribacteria bacterium]|nr:putative DNA binding domain-containing protein [Candidatus Poribacteria bacterium]
MHFANTQGGVILIGVTDNSTVKGVSGNRHSYRVGGGKGEGG